MPEDREAFLAGERPEDVLVYLDEAVVSNPEALEGHGDRIGDGIVLVVAGNEARSVFQQVAGVDPMAFAREAMDTEGEVYGDCTGGVCPDAGADPGSHDARLVFAFAEAQNDEAGGIYADGDVIHAYVSCACGTTYSDRWVAGER